MRGGQESRNRTPEECSLGFLTDPVKITRGVYLPSASPTIRPNNRRPVVVDHPSHNGRHAAANRCSRHPSSPNQSRQGHVSNAHRCGVVHFWEVFLSVPNASALRELRGTRDTTPVLCRVSICAYRVRVSVASSYGPSISGDLSSPAAN